MPNPKLALSLLALACFACKSPTQKAENPITYKEVQVIGAMKNVMWKGELNGVVSLDTLENRSGLYAIGPEQFLTGELLINDGKAYVSRVTSDSTQVVEKTFATAAPFLVYANVTQWKELLLPKTIRTLKELEPFLDEKTKDLKRPFSFKLQGTISSASIHIQNLPKGTKVSSPKEAHQGQVSFELGNTQATLVGFFSTEHQGIFTHHDSFMHLHLITQDESSMGHLDAVHFQDIKLYLPVQ